MKKFGFGKKERSEKDDGDSIRSGIFGRKKPIPSQEENPYAQQPAEDPYARMSPYQQARTNLATSPRGPPAGLPSGPSPSSPYGTPPPSYSAPAPDKSGFQPQKYGASGGYGSNRYDVGTSAYGPNRTGASAAPSYGTGRVSARGPGGYGGLGPAEETDNKNELLAGATGKYVKQGTSAPSQQPGITDSGSPAATNPQPGGYGSSGGYGEERELTAEELEEQDLQGIRNEVLQTKRDDVATLQRINQLGLNTLQLADSTTRTLDQQEDMLLNTDKNLDTSRIYTKIADEKTQELKTLNRSMFAVGNPFTKSKRERQAIEREVQNHQGNMNIQGGTRANGYKVEQERRQRDKGFNSPNQAFGVHPPTQREKKYMLEDDDAEDEELEDEIAVGIGMASGLASELHKRAVAMGEAVDRQNPLIDRLAYKSTDVDLGLAKTRAVMNRIR